MVNISTEFERYEYSFNRSLSSSMILPYVKSDIEIGVNEIANNSNINTSLDKLQSNLMYLYSLSKFANPNLPANYVGWLSTAISSRSYLNITFKGKFFVSGVQTDTGGVIQTTIPYFNITDGNGNNYNFVFTYNGLTNPGVEYLPVGTTYYIDISTEFSEDSLSVLEVQRILDELGFTTTYSIDGSGVITFTVQSPAEGATFFGNKNPLSYSYTFGNEMYVDVSQGTLTTTFEIHTSATSNIKPNPSNFDDLNNISIGPAELSGYNTIYACSETRIQTLSGNFTTGDFIFAGYTDKYGTNNDLNFIKINGSAYYNNSLYVSDEGRNNVVKLNISGFTRDDSHRYNRFFETEIIGGEGGVRDNYSFNKPKIIDFYNGNLYVLDQGNQSIKVYDENLGFVNNIRKYATYVSNPPIAIKIFDDKFYWLTQTGVLFIFDLELNLLDTITLERSNVAEIFLDLIISTENNNYYILTKTNIYKYFTDSNTYIGKFDLSDTNIGQINYKFLNLINVSSGKDLIYIYNKINERGTFIVCNEDENFFNLLTDYDFNIYSKEEIHLNPNAYASDFAYNGAFHKILENTLQLRNFIYRKINTIMGYDGLLTFTGVTYYDGDDLSITNYKPTLNNYIGSNEIFSRGVVNRCLGEVYNLQSQLIELYKPVITYPAKRTVNLGGNENALMLETYPGDSYAFFLLEKDEDPILDDVILLENVPLT
jgi:hypothetical protein